MPAREVTPIKNFHNGKHAVPGINSTAARNLRRSMVYDESPKIGLEYKLDPLHVRGSNIRERNIRINTAASDLLLQDSIASARSLGGADRDSARLPGYTIPKLPE